MIELKNITKIFVAQDQEITALQAINIQVKPGEIYGIIGRSGAGKSTLIRCVNLLEKPSNGKVLLHNDDLCQLSENALRQKRQKMSMIFQHFNLLSSRNVIENVMLPLEFRKISKKEIREKAEKLLELVGLQDRAEHLTSQLSGGQKQRVAIARALITDPEILLCDEPTSSLDPETTQQILQLLKKINKELNLTILLITHEMNVIKSICDRVGVLSQGKLVEENNVIDLFAHPQTQEATLLTQKALHIELPAELAKKLSSQEKKGSFPIVRLAFLGTQADKPITALLQQHFNVVANILMADLETIHDTMIGFMICQLIGDKSNIEKAITYLKEHQIATEVLGYA